VAMLCSLSIQRDTFTRTGLFFRIDALHLATWWQLHEGGSLETPLAAGGTSRSSTSRIRTPLCSRRSST
jgi:hypothetical protein